MELTYLEKLKRKLKRDIESINDDDSITESQKEHEIYILKKVYDEKCSRGAIG